VSGSRSFDLRAASARLCAVSRAIAGLADTKRIRTGPGAALVCPAKTFYHPRAHKRGEYDGKDHEDH